MTSTITPTPLTQGVARLLRRDVADVTVRANAVAFSLDSHRFEATMSITDDDFGCGQTASTSLAMLDDQGVPLAAIPAGSFSEVTLFDQRRVLCSPAEHARCVLDAARATVRGMS